MNQGEVYTPGLIITAEDGSFVLKSGEAFKTPFHNELYSNESNKLIDDLPELIGSKKARLVRVSMPGLKEPLYGAMMFPAFHKGAKGPATRLLGIDVPQKYVDAATNAKISAVFERVILENGQLDYAWILWLSDHPLVTIAPASVPKVQPVAAKVEPVAAPVVAPAEPIVAKVEPVSAKVEAVAIKEQPVVAQ